MSELKTHIYSDTWIDLFTEKERGHILSFWYNLFLWLERDQADKLELFPKEFIWTRAGTIVGSFPITTPEPDRGFDEVLLTILERDIVLQKYLKQISGEELKFDFVLQKDHI